MKEVELDDMVDGRLQKNQRARGCRRQHPQLCLRKVLLQAPKRGECSNEIADMIELDGQDALDPISIDQRMANVEDAETARLRAGIRRNLRSDAG